MNEQIDMKQKEHESTKWWLHYVNLILAWPSDFQGKFQITISEEPL